MKLKIKYIPNSKGETVNKPFYATTGSAGMDLSACLDETVVIKKGEIKMIPTGIAISLHISTPVADLLVKRVYVLQILLVWLTATTGEKLNAVLSISAVRILQ